MTQDLERNEGGLPVRELGKTGLKVSIIGFGGGHCVRPDIDEQTTVRLMQLAIDAGVTFMDNAWEYHQGEAERRMGLALKGRRDQVTLMTKVCARDRKTAEAQLHESLGRLQTDVIDVWQFHQVRRSVNQLHRCTVIRLGRNGVACAWKHNGVSHGSVIQADAMANLVNRHPGKFHIRSTRSPVKYIPRHRVVKHDAGLNRIAVVRGCPR